MESSSWKKKERAARPECRNLLEASEKRGSLRYNEVCTAIPPSPEQDYCNLELHDCEHFQNAWNIANECINEGFEDKTNKAFGKEGTGPLQRMRLAAGRGEAVEEAFSPGTFKMALGMLVDQNGAETGKELEVQGRLRTDVKYGEKCVKGCLRLDAQTAAVLREYRGVRALGLIDTCTSEERAEICLGAA